MTTSGSTIPTAANRRDRVTATMNTDSAHSWTGRELSAQLQVKPRNLLTQLSEWTHLGFFLRSDAGTYALVAPP